MVSLTRAPPKLGGCNEFGGNSIARVRIWVEAKLEPKWPLNLLISAVRDFGREEWKAYTIEGFDPGSE